MTKYNTLVWVDVLQSTVDNYNSVVHSSTGFAPDYLHYTEDEETMEHARDKMEERNEQWVKKNTKHSKLIEVGDSVRVSNLVFKDFRKEKLTIKSYKVNWSRKIYTVVSISKPREDWKQPLYTVEDSDGNRLQVFRDDLQLLPSPAPRKTPISSRPKSPDFFYREEQREKAREKRGSYECPLVEPFQLSEEHRKRRRPSTMMKEYYL